jgi:hypothetical protein
MPRRSVGFISKESARRAMGGRDDGQLQVRWLHETQVARHGARQGKRSIQFRAGFNAILQKTFPPPRSLRVPSSIEPGTTGAPLEISWFGVGWREVPGVRQQLIAALSATRVGRESPGRCPPPAKNAEVSKYLVGAVLWPPSLPDERAEREPPETWAGADRPLEVAGVVPLGRGACRNGGTGRRRADRRRRCNRNRRRHRGRQTLHTGLKQFEWGQGGKPMPPNVGRRAAQSRN